MLYIDINMIHSKWEIINLLCYWCSCFLSVFRLEEHSHRGFSSCHTEKTLVLKVAIADQQTVLKDVSHSDYTCIYHPYYCALLCRDNKLLLPPSVSTSSDTFHSSFSCVSGGETTKRHLCLCLYLSAMFSACI